MSLDKVLLGAYPSLESDTSVEDDESVQSPVEGTDDTGAQIDGENIVEGDLTEAAGIQRDIDEAVEEEEELNDTAEGLESYLLLVSEAKRQGGLTRNNALHINFGMNQMLRRTKITANDITEGSLESFTDGTERERIHQTEAVENRIKDAIISIWEAIKRAVNKVITFVRKWYLKIFDGASRLKKRADNIRKKADNTTGTTKDKKMSTSMLEYLNIGKAMPKGSDLVGHLNFCKNVLNELTSGRMQKDYSNTLDEMESAVTDVIDGEGKLLTIANFDKLTSKANSTSLLNLFDGSLTDTHKKQLNNNIENYAVGSVWKVTKTLPGNKLFAFPNMGDTITGMVTKNAKLKDGGNPRTTASNIAGFFRMAFNVKLINSDNKHVEVDSSKEVEILSTSDVSQIAQAVVELCDVVIDYKKAFENYDKRTSKLIAKMDQTIRKIRMDDLETDERNRAEIGKALASGLGSLMKNHSTSINTVTNYSIALARNSLVYGLQSLGKYSDRN